MRLLGIFVGLLLTTLGAGASWAGGSLKDGPMPVVGSGCGGAFSGAYIGGQVGYIDHDAKFHDELGTGHVSGSDNGVTLGIYSGYNIQCGRFLYGIESDFNYAGTDARWSDGCCQDVSSEMNWFGTLRGRLGLVHNDTWLFFITGGLAYADFDYQFSLGAPLNFSQSNSEMKFGWTIGGGVEFLRHANWSLKAEALYVDLGKEEIGYEDTLCGVGCTARIGYEDEFWVARIGLSYHFGRREETYAPLK
jgi:outer membrane immunogenic protein